MVAMMQSIVLLLVGFVLLIKGADFFVEGSSSVARTLRIPSMIVGLTIVAMGTSLPELAVSVTASVAGNNALAVSNVIGSNLFNLMLVCGACALFAPLIVQKDTLKKEIPVSVLCAVLLFVLGISGMEIGRTDGVILLLLFIGFLVWMVRSALKAHAASAEAEDPSGEYKIYPAWKCALYIVGGAVAIKFGGDFVVDGASAIAVKAGLSQNLIGLTIVAMGTSLPECAVSVTASLTGNNSLAVSNVVGSNIFNLMVVCGACALFAPLTIKKDTLKKEFPLSIICAALLMVLGYVGMLLGHLDGGVFLLIFAAYLIWMIGSAKKARAAHKESQMMLEEGELVDEEIQILPLWKCALFIVGGMIAIKFGGDFVVDSASALASAFGLSQTLIGLTIVAMGTSLPELVTSIVAARKNEVDMALGNVIGSNIFNILLVLGVAAAISPVKFLTDNIIDTVVLIAMSLVVLVFAWTSKMIDRREGATMLGMYAVYMAYICIR